MEKRIYHLILPIQKQKAIAPSYWVLSLQSPQISSVAAPGQFVMLKIGKNFDPLLPRPMSIHSIIKEDNQRIGFTILYKVVGKGTRLLSEKISGEKVGVIGPLGTGFNLNHIASGYEPIVVGGGIGIAPLLFLAHKLVEMERTPAVFLGANSQEELLALDEFESLGLKAKVSTEDGSKGVKGMITDLLGSYLEDNKGLQGEIFACGPAPMLEKVASLAKNSGMNSQLSLEQRMACGLGACLGCVVKIRNKNSGQSYQRVCTEGPVFNGEDIIW